MDREIRVTANKLVSQQAYDLLAKEVFDAIKKKANTSHQHSADDITDSTTKKIPTIAKQTEWDKKVDEAKLQQELQKVVSGLAWKGVFDTLDALKKAITQPKEGDFVIVTKEPTYKNKNTLLIYEGEPTNNWQTVGELFVPGKATTTTDGLMSKEDKAKLDGITNDKLLTPELKQKYDKASADATSALNGLGNKVDKNRRIVALKGLSGGGTLENDIELNIVSKNDGILVGDDDITLQTVDNLTTTSATKPLSANQGKVIKGLVDGNTSKITAVESKVNDVLTTEEAQQIVNKYKG